MNSIFTMHVEPISIALELHYIRSSGISLDRRSLISCFVYLSFRDSGGFCFGFEFGFIAEFTTVVFYSALRDHRQ